MPLGHMKKNALEADGEVQEKCDVPIHPLPEVLRCAADFYQTATDKKQR